MLDIEYKLSLFGGFFVGAFLSLIFTIKAYHVDLFTCLLSIFLILIVCLDVQSTKRKIGYNDIYVYFLCILSIFISLLFIIYFLQFIAFYENFSLLIEIIFILIPILYFLILIFKS